MKILFLVPYPLKISPSQRFRFEQYFSVLTAAGHSYEIQSFLKLQDGKILFRKGNIVRKTFTLIRGLIRRFFILFRVPNFDRVFIHREALPAGPPLIEWIIVMVLKKKIIYDFDDAIWLTDRGDEPRWLKTIKWRSKVKSICRWSYKVSGGNEYLCSYARQFNKQVIFNPSTIDTERVHTHDRFPALRSGETTIGWTGSHSTLKYLTALEGALKQLEKEYPHVKFVIIADQPPKLSLKSIHYIPWCAETEMEALRKIDIGIMPLPDDEWSKGKCGLKILQYLALEIPAVASPVGVNSDMIIHGKTGYLAKGMQEWIHYLSALIIQDGLRRQLGSSGRQYVQANYSVKSNSSNFLSLFE